MKYRFFLSTLLLVAALALNAQKGQNKSSSSDEGYKFTPVVQLKATPVKDQASTGTCWDFATTSFIESELLRTGKGEFDLSEMYIVRNNYVDRLKDNFEKKGKGNTGEGGQGHDWIIEFTKNGIVPAEVYTGLNYGSPRHSHWEMNSFLGAVAGVTVKSGKESDQYFQIVNAILDTYLGKVPETFTYKGVGYTPKSFSASLQINPEDYVELTSFTIFPFYTRGVVPFPDNWRNYNDYNVPLDDLIAIMDYSLNNGYTVNWDGDVSEKGFAHGKGVAIIPEVEKTDLYTPAEKAKYGKMTIEERTAEAYKFSHPFPEVKVTQESREAGYDAGKTTDDHSMHITGIAKDQNGTKYYITKNSWGTNRNPFGGYLNMSEQYVRAKTIYIMVNKNGIPPEIRTKLGIS
ncbi:MAG TPA: C1 family peptidase [Bacteroidales bacterium]|nr:C1 family peptidase [Bacteroidales bacterium]